MSASGNNTVQGDNTTLDNFDFDEALKLAKEQEEKKNAGLSEKEIEQRNDKERKEAAKAAREKQAIADIECYKEVLRIAMIKQTRVAAAAAVGRSKKVGERVKPKAVANSKPKKGESKKADGVMPWRKGEAAVWEDEEKRLKMKEEAKNLKDFEMGDNDHSSTAIEQAGAATSSPAESVALAREAAKRKAAEGTRKRSRDEDEEEDSVEKRCRFVVEDVPSRTTRRPLRDRKGKLIDYAKRDQDELKRRMAAASVSGRTASKDTTMEDSSEDNRDAPASPDSESSTSSQFSASTSSTSSSSTSSSSSSASSQSSAPPIVFANQQEKSNAIQDLINSVQASPPPPPPISLQTMLDSLPDIPTAPRTPYQLPQMPTTTLPPLKHKWKFFEDKNRPSKWWRKFKDEKYKPMPSNKESVYTRRPVKQAPPACKLFAQNSAVALKAVREQAGSGCSSFEFAHVYNQHCELLDAIKEEREKGGMEWVYLEELPLFEKEFVWTPAQNAETFKWTPPKSTGPFNFEIVKRRE